MQANISKLERKLEQANASIKPLKIESDKGRLRIRVRRKDMNFTKYTFDYSDDGIDATLAICRDILTDYYRGNFDNTLVKYGLSKPNSPKFTEVTHLPVSDNSEPDLLEIWESYKALKPNTPNSTKKLWVVIDMWLRECPNNCLQLCNADKLLFWLRTKYTDGSLNSSFRLIKAACNLAIKLGKLSNNPYLSIYELLDKTKKKVIKSFTKTEIRVIIQAFKDSRFDSSHSAFPSAYYAPLIEFRFLTGCRPSEAIALTWSDIKDTGDKCQIVFSKRYTSGQLLQGTKNGINARVFPCNKQLTDFIRSIPKIPNDNDLVFPSYEGKYLTSGNLSGIWRKYILKLVALNVVSKYLPFYDERHTYITHVTRSGVDLKTTASISGNSAKTIMNNYLASNNDIDLPEI